jgi:L-histidine N-alpha-methyltransferase
MHPSNTASFSPMIAAPGSRKTTAAAEVRRGLTASPKSLPPHLFYDAAGSRLYERITALPEYYLSRAEHEILEAHADDVVARAADRGGRPLTIVELGAGSATKTEALLRALLRRQNRCEYIPVDVSHDALVDAERRLSARFPDVRVRPLAMTHHEALRVLRHLEPPHLILFIGSSVGNLEDAEASALFRGLRGSLGSSASLLLGTDLRKSPDVLLPAYDDASGVTAAFNKNVLSRINRELGGHFDIDRFRHVAKWNDAESRIEMHLESVAAQEVAIDLLGMCVRFRAGETIHTESSVKYDAPRVERIVDAGGFHVEETYYDRALRVALHWAKATVSEGGDRARALIAGPACSLGRALRPASERDSVPVE